MITTDRGEIRRPITTVDGNGEAFLQSWRTITPEHDIDILELRHNQRFIADQLQIKISHHIMPYLQDTQAIQLGDFYFVDSDKYNIVEKTGKGEQAYFSVWHDDSGIAPASSGIYRAYYQAGSLTPAAYSFGSGDLASIPAFSSTPIPFFTKRNHGGFYIPSISASGLVLADRGAGVVPQIDVQFYESISSGDGGLWMATGLAAGSYTFGSGSLASIPPVIDPEPDVFVYDEGVGRAFLAAKSKTGFTLYETGFGPASSSTVVIFEKPLSGENRWAIEGLTPGSYTFGTGDLAEISGLVVAPDIYAYNTNSGDHYFASITATGFVLADMGIGETPVVNIVVVKK